MGTELKRVLVAVDESEAGRWAAERAAWLPRSEQAVVTLLYVVDPELQLAPLVQPLAEDEAPQLLGAVERAARTAAVAANRSLHLAPVFARGVPFVEIVVRRAREDAADLVVVGVHDTSGLGDDFLGSTAQRVVRKGGSAVLVVKRPAATAYRRLLIAVDLSSTCQRAALLALRMVTPSATIIDVLHVRDASHTDAQARQAMLDFLAPWGGAPGDWNVIIREGDPRRVILHEAAERQPDLLVLGTHGRSAIAELLIGSVAEAVVRSASCDVLLARPEHHTFVMP